VRVEGVAPRERDAAGLLGGALLAGGEVPEPADLGKGAVAVDDLPVAIIIGVRKNNITTCKNSL
jgi:hypothetical protein